MDGNNINDIKAVKDDNNVAPNTPDIIATSGTSSVVKPAKSKGKKVLVGLLIVLLLAAVGAGAYYFGYKQGETKAQETAEADYKKKLESIAAEKEYQTEEETTKNTKSVTLNASSADYSLKYPDTWTAVKDDKPTYSYTQKITITPPSKSLTIEINAKPQGIGGACLPQSVGVLSDTETEKITNMSGYSFARYITVDGQKVGYFAGILPDADAANVKPGNSFCDVFLKQFVTNADKTATEFVFAITSSSKSVTDNPTVEEVQAFFNSADFAEAKQIILSATTNK